MKQQQFEAEHAPLWERIAAILDGAGQREALPELYRQLCQCLALASQRGYAPALTDYLQKMVGDCHKRLYGASVARPALLLRWLAWDLPRRVRAEWRLLLLACLAFFGVALVVGLLVWDEPYRAYSFSSAAQLEEYRTMYTPGKHKGRGGDAGDVMMFGFYIWNNVSIGFRTFAGGLFGGVPALLSLASNGMHMGVIGAWVSRDPQAATMFWSFVITHSSFEVAGLLLSGVAGMRLGLSLINPGRLRRRDSLQAASVAIFPVIVGAALLTVLAAFFEGFWSASTAVTPQAKYIAGAVTWTLVAAYFLLAGRARRKE
jgi:uncharacterized membrane protein SpoIIM required for sporulation